MKKFLFLLLMLAVSVLPQEKSKSSMNPDTDSEIHLSADKMPEIAGGVKALAEKIVYPAAAKEEGIEGIVFVACVVNEQGDVIKREVLKSAHPALDKAALEAVNGLKFTPGVKDGKNVKVKVTLPISFKLNGKEKQEKAEQEKAAQEKAKQKSETSVSGDAEEKVFTQADVMPEIVGGMESLAKNIAYPAEAKENKVEGKVIVTAVIDEKGDAVKLKVLKSVGYGCDEAAIEAVKKTKFLPGKKDGKTVKVQITIPIMFKLG